MAIKKEHAVIGIIIALLVGSGAGYFYGQFPIAGYKEDIQSLETENLELKSQLEQLQEEHISLQGQLDNTIANLTLTRSSLTYLQELFSDLQLIHESLQTSYSELEGKYERFKSLYSVLENSYSVLEKEYNSLELSYEEVKEDYENLRMWMPPKSGILPYLELKKSPEGYSRNDLISQCGQMYLLQPPVNADVWKINITIMSELDWQSVHITIYTIYESYPPDFSEQPFAPNARGKGNVSISLELDTSQAYVAWISDAYAKPFTGFIEEYWYVD